MIGEDLPELAVSIPGVTQDRPTLSADSPSETLSLLLGRGGWAGGRQDIPASPEFPTEARGALLAISSSEEKHGRGGAVPGLEKQTGALHRVRGKAEATPSEKTPPCCGRLPPDSRFWTFWRFHPLSCALSAVASVKSLNAFTHLIPTRALRGRCCHHCHLPMTKPTAA